MRDDLLVVFILWGVSCVVVCVQGENKVRLRKVEGMENLTAPGERHEVYHLFSETSREFFLRWLCMCVWVDFLKCICTPFDCIFQKSMCAGGLHTNRAVVTVCMKRGS